jgi:hypothetical protein
MFLTNLEEKMKPECVADYNAFMHGVDSAYQYLALHPIMRKTVKWAKKTFFTSCSAQCLTYFGYFKKQTHKRDWNALTSRKLFHKNYTWILPLLHCQLLLLLLHLQLVQRLLDRHISDLQVLYY